MKNDKGRRTLFTVGERPPIDASPETLARIAELEAKEDRQGLTGEEFAELRSLMGFGEGEAVVNVAELPKMGVSDPRVMLRNLRSLDERVQRAIHHGFYIEAISLTLLVLDFSLRGYLANKTGKPVNERRVFGKLISEAEETGLDQKLIARLREFNKNRVAAVHHLLLGKLSYEEIREPCLTADGLIADLMAAIAEDLGQ